MQSSIAIIEIVWRLLRKLNYRGEDVSVKCLLLHEDLNLDSPPYKRSGVGAYNACNPRTRGMRKDDPWGFLATGLAEPVSSGFRERPYFTKIRQKVIEEYTQHQYLADWRRCPASISVLHVYIHTHEHIHTCVYTLLASLCTCAIIPAALFGSVTCTFNMKVRIWDRYSLSWSCSISATTRLTSRKEHFKLTSHQS